MKYKVLTSLFSCIIAFANIAAAQQIAKNPPRVGIIASPGASESFRLGLRDLGYFDGKNILIERKYQEGRLDRIPGFISDFTESKVDIIVAINNVAIRAAKQATKTIPIVIVTSVDPVEAGYVNSFARPGGNITGLANLGRDLSAKRVELLKELLPSSWRVGVLWDAEAPGPRVAVKEYELAARAFKLDLRSVEVHGPKPDFLTALNTLKTSRADALIIVGNPLMAQYAKLVLELAMKNRLPSMTEERRYVDAGGLISYGANAADLYRRAAEYVVQILKGANPSDLPVRLATKFEIFVNLKTAKQIGVVIPQHVLVQADKVIQ